MRMVLAGDWSWEIYEEALATGFRAHDVEVIPFRISAYLGNNLLSKAQRKLIFGPQIKKLNTELLRLVCGTSPAVLFLSRPVYLYPETIAAIKRSTKVALVTYNNDNPFTDGATWSHWRHYFKVAKLCDLNLFYRPSNLVEARHKGIPSPNLLLPYFVAGVHQPRSGAPSQFASDVVFIGHYEPDGRADILDSFIENGLNVRIFGTRWEECNQLCALVNRPILPLRREDYVRALSATKLALVFLSQRNRDVYTRRCFEIPACRTAMLAPRTNELLELFREEEEALYFSSKEEALAKARFYLANTCARERVAQRGYERCLRDGHSNIDRAKSILSAINRIHADHQERYASTEIRMGYKAW